LIGKVPLLGISTGHHVLARALGGKVTKMKVAHRGVNYPVLSGASYRGEITVQNHSGALDPASLSKSKGIKITAFNLNDRSVEEFEGKKLRLIGAQYYAVSPGPGQAHEVFKRFGRMLV
ncbi:MAG: carbamoyl phosphate synthase small subunit, partial [Candidatus Omnitrophica bacterium]|nr:carbamoyl phosphate synthase small subunit [Candidatus Omnitrophota bacterium]